MPGFDQAFGREFIICLQHRIAGNIQIPSEKACRWKTVSRPDRTGPDRCGELLANLAMQGTPTIPAEFDMRDLNWLPQVALSILAGIRHHGKPEETTVISGGNATIYVSNMDDAVRFYSEVLGLKLTYRFGNEWAMVDAGPGLAIGLHPASPMVPAPGTKGAMHIGFELDEPIEQVVTRLKAKGVRFTSDIAREPHGAVVLLEDPDGNPIYFRDSKGASRPAEQEHAGTRA